MSNYKRVVTPISRLREDRTVYGLRYLPLTFINLILDRMTNITWYSSYVDENGNSVELTPDDKDFLSEGIRGLCEEMDIINNITTNCDCCACTGSPSNSGCVDTFPNVDSNPYLPIFPVDDTQPPSTTAHGLTDTYLCDVAHYLTYSLVETAEWLADTWETLSFSIDSLYTFIEAKWGIGGGIGTAAVTNFLLTQISTIGTQLYLLNKADDHKDAWFELRPQLICLLVGAESPSQARIDWFLFIKQASEVYGKVVYYMMWVWSKMLDFDRIYGGDIIIPSLYENSDCTDCTPPPTSESYDYTYCFDFSVDADGWQRKNNHAEFRFSQDGEGYLNMWSRDTGISGGYNLNHATLFDKTSSSYPTEQVGMIYLEFDILKGNWGEQHDDFKVTYNGHSAPFKREFTIPASQIGTAYTRKAFWLEGIPATQGVDGSQTTSIVFDVIYNALSTSGIGYSVRNICIKYNKF